MSRKRRNAPAAFMSYVREDDMHGRLTDFRERIEDETRMQLGEPFPIFQDRNDIRWGQNWKSRIEDTVDAVTLLIPIITPSFFRSPACRDELQRFAEREKALARSDLILPIYYVDTPLLNDSDRRSTDELAELLAARQYADWRSFRFEPFSSPEVGKLLAGLASQIRDALDRVHHARTTTSGSSLINARSRADAGSGSEPTMDPTQLRGRPLQHNDPPTHIVDQLHRGDFATITEAIQAAQPGDRIRVRPGYYQEGLVIDKPLEIVGEGELSEIVVSALARHALLFQTTMGRVSNITFRQAGGGPYAGIVIAQGRLELEACDISSESKACVEIFNYADPRLRRNRIHSGKEVGVYVHSNGRGTLEDNEIFNNTLSGIGISNGGDPMVRRNRIRDGKETGVFVYENGRGTLEDNDIFGNKFSGVEIREASDPTLRRNRIRDSQGHGVHVHENGRGTLQDNDIHDNARAGIHIKGRGKLLVRSNRIIRNSYEAIWISDGGGGSFLNNDLRDNARGAWDIEEGAGAVERSENIEDEAEFSGEA